MSKLRIELTRHELIALVELYVDVEVGGKGCFTPTNERVYDKLFAKLSPKMQKEYRPYWRDPPPPGKMTMHDMAKILERRMKEDEESD